MHFGPPSLPGRPWVPLGMQRILYGFGSNCLHLPGSYTANLYGQVSCDYTCSQSQRMVLNDLRKSQSINVFNVLRGNWDPTDKQFSSVNSYRQDLLRTCKAFPKEPPHAFGSHKVTKSAMGQQLCRRPKCCDLIWLYAGQSNTKCCSSSTQSNDLHTRHSLSVLSR